MNYTELIGSNVIYNWYLEFENIVSLYSEYVNILIEQKNLKSTEPETIYEYSKRLRGLVISNYLRSNAILKAIGIKDRNTEINKYYLELISDNEDNLMVKKSSVEGYIKVIQEILIAESIQEILANAESTINNVFGSKTGSNSNN